MNKKNIHIMAGIPFLLWFLLSCKTLIFYVQQLLNPDYHMPSVIGYIIICLSMLIIGIGLVSRKTSVSAAGSICLVVGYFLNGNLWNVYSIRFLFQSGGIMFFAAVLLAILCFVKPAAKVLGIIAAALVALATIPTVAVFLRYELGIPALFVLSVVLQMIGFAAIGFALYEKKAVVRKEEKSSPDIGVQGECYCDLIKHILLLLFTLGVWHYIWIYRTTGYLNCVKGEEYRNPTNKLLLCLFVPFYIIYWTYKSAQRIDKLAAEKNIPSELSTLCLILEIFIPIIPPILMQDKINSFALSHDSNATSGQTTSASPHFTNTTDELLKCKELLDKGIITQEEFDAKKKQLLGL